MLPGCVVKWLCLFCTIPVVHFIRGENQFNISSCINEILFRDDETLTVVWRPPKSSRCRLILTGEVVTSNRIAIVRVDRLSYSGTSTCRPWGTCLSYRGCLNLIYSNSTNTSYLAPLYIWNWSQFSARVLLKVPFSLAFIYCGDQPIEVTVRFTMTSTTTSRTPVVNQSSWNTGIIVTHLLIPGLSICTLIILISLLVLCLLRRYSLNHSSVIRQRGHANPSYEEEPPNYNDYHKYPLSEGYKLQVLQAEAKVQAVPNNKDTIVRISTENSQNIPTTAPIMNPGISYEGPSSSHDRNSTPPPDYSCTRRIKDEDGVSIYEVVMVEEVSGEKDTKNENHILA